MEKKLYRSAVDKKLAGVCGGLAEYFGVDATIVCIAWIVFMFMDGAGILLYLIMMLVMPQRPA
ncbi:MAG: PspC domain-containing protein [Coprobacter sp.]|nr:PspC domain-containing protein [Coprobacter sp.]